MDPMVFRNGAVPTVTGIAFLGLMILFLAMAACEHATKKDRVCLVILGILMGCAASIKEVVGSNPTHSIWFKKE
jgi:uncharacterized membrane protein YhhN